MKPGLDWRRTDRTVFLTASVLFALFVLVGFGPTYYLRFAFSPPPVPSFLVHAHGIVMTAWVGFFITQVFLIRQRLHRTHMTLGLLGIALAIFVFVIGFFTAAAAAKYGSTSAPPDMPPLAFFIVPLTDMIVFAGLFGAAIYYRKRPADHKRLMLLTVINFLPPAVARISIAPLQAAGPLFFFGLPALIIVGFVIFDTWSTGKLNRPLLIGSLVLLFSYPLRLVIAMTDGWTSLASWIVSWAA